MSHKVQRFVSIAFVIGLSGPIVILRAADAPSHKPSATMGPTSGTDASQSTPSLKAVGKEAFNGLDKDGDGELSKAEAQSDAPLMKTFEKVDENKDGKLDTAEFARSTSESSPAEIPKPPDGP